MKRKKVEQEVPTRAIINKKDNKDIAVETLISQGYDAFLQDGIVFCKNITENTYKEMTEILKKIGYKASYGVISSGEVQNVAVEKKEEVKEVGSRESDPRLQELYDKNISVYSISRLDTINNCKYEGYRTYILKDKGKPNIYAELGGQIHEILEGITKGTNTEADLFPAIKTELDNLEALSIEFPKDKSGNDTIRNNWIADMTHFAKTYKPPVGKSLTAEEFVLYQDSNGHWLQGYIDLIKKNKDGSIDLYDFKSSTLYSAADMAKHARQLIVYALAKEQEGIKVRSASFIFLKYVTIKFMGKKTPRSKEKTEIVKNIERRKIGTELEGYIYADLIENGYDEMDAEIIVDKFKKENMLTALPDDIVAKYTMKPCVIAIDLSDDAKQETLNYIEETIKEWEALDSNNEYDYPPRSFTKFNKSNKEVPDYFYCASLCGHSSNCPHYHDFIDQLQTDDKDDDLF